jgi:hypothetical protein
MVFGFICEWSSGFFIVIADLQPPYNGIGLTQVSGFREKVLKGAERWFFQMASSQHSLGGIFGEYRFKRFF